MGCCLSTSNKVNSGETAPPPANTSGGKGEPVTKPPTKTKTDGKHAPGHYDYGTECGPAHWGRDFPAANGKHQSPVDIMHAQAVYDETLAQHPLAIGYHNDFATKLQNNGHTFMFTGESANSEVTGGPAKVPHRFLQFHMHWGPNDSAGGEHTIDGHHYAAEIHFVNWNFTAYKTAADAAASGKHDGLLVVGVFVRIGKKNPEFANLIAELAKVKLANSSVAYEHKIDMSKLLPSDLTEYFTYPGSLTSPPCTECVCWVVLKHAIECSADQLSAIRNAMHMCSSNAECNDGTRMLTNFRPVCALNDRTIKKSFK